MLEPSVTDDTADLLSSGAVAHCRYGSCVCPGSQEHSPKRLRFDDWFLGAERDAQSSCQDSCPGHANLLHDGQSLLRQCDCLFMPDVPGMLSRAGRCDEPR